MEEKLVALVFVVLLIGVGSAHAFDYMIYQPQLSEVRSDVSSIMIESVSVNDTIKELQTTQENLNHTIINGTVTQLQRLDELNYTISKIRFLAQRVISDYYVWRANLTIPPGETLHITNYTAGYKQVFVAWLAIAQPDFSIEVYFTIAGLDPRFAILLPIQSPINGYESYEVEGTEVNFKIRNWNLTKTLTIDFAVYVVA